MLTGCYKFEGSQTVPAYIKIDTILLSTYYPEQGANSSGIKDVWVYVNNQQIGAFELPAMFPVLAMGEQELEIRPGIKVNGISSTRAPYPFYEPIVYSNFLFTPDSTIMVNNPQTEYYSNLNFAWMEDFEQPGLSIVESSSSDTSIVRTQPANNPVAYISENSKYSGLISLTKEKNLYSSTSSNSYPIPLQGSPTLLEIDFKSNNLITVGVIIQEYGNYIKIPLVILNHADDWNKIYVNLGPNLSLHPQATDFKVFFESVLETDKNSASIYIDNIKLINRAF
jgi:hypothetical protein